MGADVVRRPIGGGHERVVFDRSPEAVTGLAKELPCVADDDFESSKRVLDPLERISEILFGLIMVLTFTGSLSVAEAGRAEVRTMLLGALGCNLAWGVIDGVFYLMGCLEEAARKIMAWDAVRQGADPEEAQRTLAGALPPSVASVLKAAELEAMRLD